MLVQQRRLLQRGKPQHWMATLTDKVEVRDEGSGVQEPAGVGPGGARASLH